MSDIRSVFNPIVGPVTAGTQVNPDTTVVMADTTALVAGRYEVRVAMSASAAATFAIQRRDAANSANVGNVVVKRLAAGACAQFVYTFTIEASERVRVMMAASLTGSAEADIQVEKLG